MRRSLPQAVMAVLVCLTTLAVPARSSAARTGAVAPGDLVARDSAGQLWIHPYTGDPVRPWTEESRRPVAGAWQAPDLLQLSDISLDGMPDLFTRTPGDGSVGYHPTRDGAAWAPDARVLGMYGWNGVASALVEDVDRDGRPDLLARQAGGNLRVWPHDGNTTASPWLTVPPYDIAEGLERTDVVRFGDLTGDGLRDLVIREDDGSLWVLPHPGVAAAATAGEEPVRPAKRETLWRWSKKVKMRAERRMSTLAADPASPYGLGTTWADDVRLDVQDLNGDRLGDLVATDAAGDLRIYYHNGAPAGENPWPVGIRVGGWAAGYHLLAINPPQSAAATLRIEPRSATVDAGATAAFRATLLANGTSRDVTAEVTWSTSDTGVAVISTGGVATAVAKGGAAVLATIAGASAGVAALLVGDDDPGGGPRPVKPGDAVGLDRDGRLWHYPHSGDPAQPWSRTTRQLAGIDWAGPDVLTLGDVTLDGAMDLFIRDPAGTGSVWFHPHSAADPARAWSPTSKVFGMSGWNNAAAVILEDVNGDRRPDLLSRMPAGNLRFWLHDGRATSSPWLSAGNWSDIAVGLQGTDVVRFGEATGDGKRDLIIREGDGSLWILPHPGSPAGPGSAPLWRWDPARPESSSAYRVGTMWANTARLDVQDVDGDGLGDLIATAASGELGIYRHNGAALGRNPWTESTRVPGVWTDGLVAFSSMPAS
ncbi:FG-GAP-like repeat-containing protein [Nonomuraea basaltis]|uniref:FG-GAP-like repeat-containing protein n=1 Tax=Nonomuraea basaltis TaxID=2495887 RepID=UPI00110C3FDA|nr:FG-GAP-like repeat-containing protein [Nonomuraea basaltis]TMR96570.1 hypothetical protein EJK15_22680 [Nonomuraea basaltis]